MNRPAMLAIPTSCRRFALLLGAAGTLVLAACGAGKAEQPPLEQAPLAGARIGGDFALTDPDGKLVRWSDFAGRWRIVYFGYAFCPDVCPTDVQRATRGLALFAEAHPELARNVQPIFISVDPQRDTPEVLRSFTAAFSDQLIGLTGTPEQIAEAARRFGVAFSQGERAPGGGYLVNHTNITYLFGPDGDPIATLPTDQGAEAVAAELARWVR